MKIYNFPQLSPEWFAIRRTCFTATDLGPFLWNETKVALTARQNLLDEKIGGMADGEDRPPDYVDFWMKRGTRLEPQALESYCDLTGNTVRPVGFVMHDTGAFGVSPDGILTNKKSGLEMKCPCGKIQHKRLREAILPPEYEVQVHLGMAACGFDEWEFYSYHPNMPPFHIGTKRSDYTERLHDAVMDLHEELIRQRQEMAVRWEEFTHPIQTLITTQP